MSLKVEGKIRKLELAIADILARLEALERNRSKTTKKKAHAPA